jgi:hypothetical protein
MKRSSPPIDQRLSFETMEALARQRLEGRPLGTAPASLTREPCADFLVLRGAEMGRRRERRIGAYRDPPGLGAEIAGLCAPVMKRELCL